MRNPYLILIGPVRGVVFAGPVVFEVLLLVSSSSVIAHWFRFWLWSLTLGLARWTLSSAISFNLRKLQSVCKSFLGQGPDGFHGRFASGADIDEEFVLLDSEDENVPISDREINLLPRWVVSVESFEKLRVSVKARQGGLVFRGVVDFKPQGMGANSRTLDMGFCKMESTVDWSFFPPYSAT